MFKSDRKTLAGILLAVLLLGAAVYLLFVHGFIDIFTSRQRLLEFINRYRGYAALVFIGLQALQVVAAPVPGEISGFVGGVFFGAGWGIVYSTIGLTVGSWLAFLLARLAGRPLVRRIVKSETIRRYDYVMRHKGMFLAFLMFLIPGFPKDILCYLLGLGNMGQRDFLIVSTTGRLLGTTLLTMGGAFFRDRRYGALFTLSGISLLLILFTMIYRETIERWFRRQRAAQILERRNGRRSSKREERDGR